MDARKQMETLLEAVTLMSKPAKETKNELKTDKPKKEYVNSPNTSELDSQTQQQRGTDLNRAKPWQFRSKGGDNPMAHATVNVRDVKESLTRKFKAWKKKAK